MTPEEIEKEFYLKLNKTDPNKSEFIKYDRSSFVFIQNQTSKQNFGSYYDIVECDWRFWRRKISEIDSWMFNVVPNIQIDKIKDFFGE